MTSYGEARLTQSPRANLVDDLTTVSGEPRYEFSLYARMYVDTTKAAIAQAARVYSETFSKSMACTQPCHPCRGVED